MTNLVLLDVNNAILQQAPASIVQLLVKQDALKEFVTINLVLLDAYNVILKQALALIKNVKTVV